MARIWSKLTVGAVVATAATASLAVPTGAWAANEPTPGVDRAALSSFFDEYGVSAEAQGILFEKLTDGDLWNSMDGSDPLEVSTSDTGSKRETVSRFADGSILVESISYPDPNATVLGQRSVGACQSYGPTGTGFRTHYDCKASASTGIMLMGFYISYTLVQGGYDYIINAHSPMRYTEGGTATAPVLSIPKKQENAAGSAFASISSTFTGPYGQPSGTYEMRALVGGDSAWTLWARRGVEP